MIIRKAIDDDFDFIYQLSSKNTDLLGFTHPMEIRQAISDHKCIIAEVDGKQAGFCLFNPLKKVPNMITVQVMCVDPNFRGQGIGTNMVRFLQNTFNRHIKCTCVKDSTAEIFWSRLGEKYEESAGKKRAICKYIIRTDIKNTLF